MTIKGIKFEATENDKAVSFILNHNLKEYRVVISRELSSDELGNDASFDERTKYVEDNFEEIRKSCVVKIGGGFAREPFASGVSVRPV